jgi:hypothetical protein
MLFNRLRRPMIDFPTFCGLMSEVAEEFFGQDFEAYEPGISKLNSMQKFSRFKQFLLAANPYKDEMMKIRPSPLIKRALKPIPGTS